MNQQKIGCFIQQLRKEKNMTQVQLAHKLNVTDRAISNWENGRRMPDLSLIKPLCDELNVSINELLSGERINKEEYQKKFEDNLLSTVEYANQKVKGNRLLSKLIVGFVIVCILLGSILKIYIDEEIRKENLYINQFYSTLNLCINEIDYVLDDNPSTNKLESSIQFVHYTLRDMAEELEDGYQFVDERVPSVVSSWFYEMASKTNDVLNEKNILTVDGIDTLNEINKELKELKSNLVDKDNLNLKEMTIEEFSIIIKDFYYDNE